jgi:N-carbamoyl-L-amino-acid hydrolase
MTPWNNQCVALAVELGQAIDESSQLPEDLFAELRRRTADGAGVTRASYGPGEQIAHDLLADAARALDLEISTDAARNLYMTLPGERRDLPSWITGSHLDSVPNGGNYDGAAGVVAGITALAGLRRLKATPARDVTVMAIRSEEAGSWFGGRHNSLFGSRAALGTLTAGELDSAICLRSGKTLRQIMQAAGANPTAVSGAPAHLRPRQFKGFLELHIEQGPVLEGADVPVGLVTAIRGGVWARDCVCHGTYTHAGAVPRHYRHDAVIAVSNLIAACDQLWDDIEDNGRDLVFTVGKLHTDKDVDSLTKVAGLVRFCLDVRSEDLAILTSVRDQIAALCRDISERRGVIFDIGTISLDGPIKMDEALRRAMRTGAEQLGIAAMEMPSGGGHDAGEFTKAGIPSAMIFVRNQHGSHNPQESLQIDDFVRGTKLLAWMLAG